MWKTAASIRMTAVGYHTEHPAVIICTLRILLFLTLISHALGSADKQQVDRDGEQVSGECYSHILRDRQVWKIDRKFAGREQGHSSTFSFAFACIVRPLLAV